MKKAEEGARLSKQRQQLVHRAEKNRKIFFTVRWIEYLLSRDFASLFHQTAAIFKRSGTNLREKAQGKWKADEKAYMKRPIYNKEMQYPLNSICDKIEGKGEQIGAKSAYVYDTLISTLGNNREQIIKRQNVQQEDNQQRDDSHFHPNQQPASQNMSLEDMEALCSAEIDEEAEFCPESQSNKNGDIQFVPVRWQPVTHFA